MMRAALLSTLGLLWIAAAPASGSVLVSDDFDSTSSGSGWAGASSWSPGLSIVSGTPYIAAPSPEHAQSAQADTLRSLDPTAASSIDSATQVWVGFVARLGGAKQDQTFAGISFYAGATETVFMGATLTGTTWGVERAGFPGSPGSSGVAADATWVSLVYLFDFGAGQIDVYVDGTLRVSYTDMPSRGWDAMRIKHDGPTPLFADQLRIATSMSEALPAIGGVAQSTDNGPTRACKPVQWNACETDADCSSFCEVSGSACVADFNCGAGTCSGSGAVCIGDSGCDEVACIGTCQGLSVLCADDAGCNFGSCLPPGFPGFPRFCEGGGVTCTSDADCVRGCVSRTCSGTSTSCTSGADCGGTCVLPERCLPDTCQVNQNQDTPVYSWKLCPDCGETEVSGSSVVVPSDGIAYDHTGQGQCLFDQSTSANAAVIAYAPLVLSGGFDCCLWQAECAPLGTCDTTEGTVNFVWGSEVGAPVLDPDADGLPSDCDNCPSAPNFGTAGTCTAGDGGLLGMPCGSNEDCGSGGFCSLNQEDTDGDGYGDACLLPEPGSFTMLTAGIGLLSVLYRRRLAARPCRATPQGA
jgi:hypothetical protein